MAAENLCVLPRLDEEERHEYWAALALRHCRGLGTRSIRRLFERFGSAYAAIRHVDEWAAQGLGRQAGGIHAGSWRNSAKVEWDAARRVEGEVLLWTDSRYPEALREIPDSPSLLYVRGRTDLLAEIGVGVVGTRACSQRGERDARSLAGGLASVGIVVISGLAGGVDSVAHATALELPGSTIAVLGTGLDVPYPRTNTQLYARVAEQGLLVSEFAPGTQPEPRNFPIRNRIISGLSVGVLVVEASVRSGSLITARLALEQNRAVYAVGGDVGDPRSEGCQELIRKGAQPVFCAGDMLSDLRAVLLARRDARLSILLPDNFAPTRLAGLNRPEASKPADPPEIVPEGQAQPDEVQDTIQPQPVQNEPVLSAPVSASSPASAKKPDSLPRTTTSSPAPPVLAQTAKYGAEAGEAAMAQNILALLVQAPRTIEQLCELLGAPPGELSAELAILEVRRCVRCLPDTRYSLFE